VTTDPAPAPAPPPSGRRGRPAPLPAPPLRWWQLRLRVPIILVAVVAVVLVTVWAVMLRMPGDSHAGTPFVAEATHGGLADELRRDVVHLAGTIGERNTDQYAALVTARDWLSAQLTAAGHVVHRQDFTAAGQTCSNLWVDVAGSDAAAGLIVVGAHYDSVSACPGANDNGSGAIALLALARRFAGAKPVTGLRFALFANEEPPHFRTPDMGSLHFAAACRQQNAPIIGMIALETLGYYSSAPRSQHYPVDALEWFYPDRGDFVAFVGNVDSKAWVRRGIGAFRAHSVFPSEGAALASDIDGIGWSDHWSFWEHGYPGLMVSDTAPFRYPHYHLATDTPDRLDYPRLAAVVAGLEAALRELAGVALPGR